MLDSYKKVAEVACNTTVYQHFFTSFLSKSVGRKTSQSERKCVGFNSKSINLRPVLKV
jgi:hypothetical protein